VTITGVIDDMSLSLGVSSSPVGDCSSAGGSSTPFVGVNTALGAQPVKTNINTNNTGRSLFIIPLLLEHEIKVRSRPPFLISELDFNGIQAANLCAPPT
jgi:hypothetical protein